MRDTTMNSCINRPDPNDMTLAQIEGELSSYEKIPYDQRTPRMADRINQLVLARRKVRLGRVW